MESSGFRALQRALWEALWTGISMVFGRVNRGCLLVDGVVGFEATSASRLGSTLDTYQQGDWSFWQTLFVGGWSRRV